MTSKKRPVFRKDINEPEAHLHAKLVCKMYGLKEGDEGYQRVYDKAFEHRIEEAAESMLVEGNPYTSKIPEYIWELFNDYNDDLEGFFAKILDSGALPMSEFKSMKSVFKGSVCSMAHVIMEGTQDIQTKSSKFANLDNKNQISNFQYRKENLDNNQSNFDEMVQVEINRYIRMFVITSIMYNMNSMLSFFNQVNVGEDAIRPELEKVFGKDNAKNFKFLKKKDSRLKFVQSVWNAHFENDPANKLLK